MRQSVKLAADARTQFLSEYSQVSRNEVKVALSLGPYGATLKPAQEFYGFYPPPYGPQGLVSSGQNRTAWTDEELSAGKEESAITALADFHLERVRIFAADPATWDAIDILAFETVPLTWEATAIRRAMATFNAELAGSGRATKAWWIGFVYTDGGLPQRTLSGAAVGASEAVRAAYGPEASGAPVPTGIAINCTRSEYLTRNVEEMEEALPKDVRPWLVLYPNGGETYDPVTQTWHGACAHTSGKGWARGLVDLTRRSIERGRWDGVIVGGCCKTGPAEIAALADELSAGKA